ncbi:S-adenosyl-L-methionine-dependent methyltransferase [Kalaharituber pfeilii]|nr:S-adenosyl-L-methionine-dependent methyltransferase [Kalaharituber pfeilii]
MEEPVQQLFQSTGGIDAALTDEDEDEEYVSDVDGGYGTGEERTSSYQSEIFDFRYENGRRYHGYREGRYALPNDEIEQNRLDIVHHLYLLLLGGELHMIPFQEHPTRILDIGTGTGIWAVEVATKYESAEVIGTDLSPIQPEWVPPNCRFDIDDAEAEWVYVENSFDFIHSRHLGVSIHDWDNYIDSIYTHLKPGGWVQFAEHDYKLYSDDGTYEESAQSKFWELFCAALTKQGKDTEVAERLEDMVKSHGGFVDVTAVNLKLPWGTWAKGKRLKELGRWVNIILESGLEAYGMALFTRELGKSHDESAALFTEIKQELKERKVHSYQFQRFVIARKKS